MPFGAVWAVLLHSFHANTGDGGGPPTFVYVIVYGQFVAFLTFCVAQLALLVPRGSAAYYYWGEVSYLVLSFVSKGLLGGTLSPPLSPSTRSRRRSQTRGMRRSGVKTCKTCVLASLRPARAGRGHAQRPGRRQTHTAAW